MSPELLSLMSVGEMRNISLTITAQEMYELFLMWDDKKKGDQEKAVEASCEIPTMTREDVSKILKVDVSTLWRWHKMGYLCAIKVGRRNLYRKSDVERIMGINKTPKQSLLNTLNDKHYA